MTDPRTIQPPTNSGSDSFARFHYQAEVTLPFCLDCALGSEIASVMPEHLEDIAVESEVGWRFVQVKSRDPERGLWRLPDLLGGDGALRSLFRTHLLTKDVPGTSLELLLEGTCKRGNPIECLRLGMDHRDPNLVGAVARALGIEEDEGIEFLERVKLLKPPSPRPNIKDTNLRLIHEQNPSLDHKTVSDIYDRLISEIERAMRADPIGSRWPHYVTHPDQAPSELAEKMESKRLTRRRLQEIVAPITSPPRYLLRRITDTTPNSISILEQKMLAGGATREIIDRARNLRANAQHRLIEVGARSIFPSDELLGDLHERLETHAVTKREVYTSSERPAVGIWNSLLKQFSESPVSLDPNNLMQQDPMLLLGETCELAELCIIDFGSAYAS
ncbi:MAG: DUF4297 domain-containing protein [candidate division Zixibacteria bacterium]|nr:DUF4297 domain-containing protein [candidate division Zixibacteria bacterium]